MPKASLADRISRIAGLFFTHIYIYIIIFSFLTSRRLENNPTILTFKSKITLLLAGITLL